jgi:hypothetical protein
LKEGEGVNGFGGDRKPFDDALNEPHENEIEGIHGNDLGRKLKKVK